MLLQVTVTLATLSFYCRRPTILAIMGFVNAINMEHESSEAFSDGSMMNMPQHDTSQEEVDDKQLPITTSESVVKGLLGKGKLRVIFGLTLNMARAQIMLMKEDESKLATLSQDNFLTDVKVQKAYFFSFFCSNINYEACSEFTYLLFVYRGRCFHLLSV